MWQQGPRGALQPIKSRCAALRGAGPYRAFPLRIPFYTSINLNPCVAMTLGPYRAWARAFRPQGPSEKGRRLLPIWAEGPGPVLPIGVWGNSPSKRALWARVAKYLPPANIFTAQ